MYATIFRIYQSVMVLANANGKMSEQTQQQQKKKKMLHKASRDIVSLSYLLLSYESVCVCVWLYRTDSVIEKLFGRRD